MNKIEFYNHLAESNNAQDIINQIDNSTQREVAESLKMNPTQFSYILPLIKAIARQDNIKDTTTTKNGDIHHLQGNK